MTTNPTSPLPEKPAQPPALSPTDFQSKADAHNARADEIAGNIAAEHQQHKKFRDDEDARHAAQLAEFARQQTEHAAARKKLVAGAGEYGCTPAWARSLLRK